MYRAECLIGSGTFGQVLGGRGRVEAVVRSKAEASSTASRTMVIKRTVLGTEDHLLSHGELRFPPPALETGLRASYKQKPERDTAGSSPRQLIHPDSKPAEPPVLAYVLGVSAACREWEASAALGYKIDVRTPLDDSDLSHGSALYSAHIVRAAPGGAEAAPPGADTVAPLGAVLPPGLSVRASEAGLPPIPLAPPFADAFLARGFVSDEDAEALDKRRGGASAGTATTEGGDVGDISPYIHLIAIGEQHGDNLYNFCRKNPARFRDPAFVACVTQQILASLASLHALGLRHRDIKGHNMLIEINGLGFPVVRLCDLGSVSVCPESGMPGAKQASTPYVTSRFYRAPELLAGATHYTTAVDVWAAACTIGELYMLSASLMDDEAAATISYCRGNGAVVSHSDPLVLKALMDEERLGTSKEAEERAIAAGKRQKAAGGSRSRAENASVFPGATNDGAQLLHIINMLGTPTKSDIEAMDLSPKCKAGLLNLCHSVILRSKGVPLPPQPKRRTKEELVADTAASYMLSRPHWTKEMAKAEARRALKAAGCYADESSYSSHLVGLYSEALAATARGASAPRGGILGGFSAATPIFPGGAIDLDRDRVLPLDFSSFLASKSVPPGIADMLARMLRWNPADRITAAEALELPCMAGPEALYLPPAVLAAMDALEDGVVDVDAEL